MLKSDNVLIEEVHSVLSDAPDRAFGVFPNVTR